MKKLKILVGAVALFALVVVNVWNATTVFRGTDLDIADVEAMANPEGIDDVGGFKEHGIKTPQRCSVQVKVVTYNCGATVDEGEPHYCVSWPVASASCVRCYVVSWYYDTRRGREVVCPWNEKKYCSPVACHEVGIFGI